MSCHLFKQRVSGDSRFETLQANVYVVMTQGIHTYVLGHPCMAAIDNVLA
jgi:hypothetical protein